MIRIRRQRKVPPRLAAQQRAGLAAAIQALNAHGLASRELKDTLSNYDGGRDALYRAQYRKCVYCERRPGFKANPVEHFRPKKEAWRNLPDEPASKSEGYWWLTWSWDNQFFSCTHCNSGHKRNYFPLVPGTAALTGPAPPYRRKRLQEIHRDVSREQAQLIDPALEDPLDHIEWRPVNRQAPKRRWKWSPSHLSDRGLATIKVLGLELMADDVGDHIRECLVEPCEQVCKLVVAGRVADAQSQWDSLLASKCQSKAEHAGATWNALDFLVDRATRAAGHLREPPRP